MSRSFNDVLVSAALGNRTFLTSTARMEAKSRHNGQHGPDWQAPQPPHLSAAAAASQPPPPPLSPRRRSPLPARSATRQAAKQPPPPSVLPLGQAVPEFREHTRQLNTVRRLSQYQRFWLRGQRSGAALIPIGSGERLGVAPLALFGHVKARRAGP